MTTIMDSTAMEVAKSRGGYYTPPEIAAWLVRWAVRSSRDSILEPSSGDGVFLEAAAKRLIALGATPEDALGRISAVEMEPREARKSAARVHEILGIRPNGHIANADFFGWIDEHPGERFDCVVGNPPFIRYQNFPEPSRSRAMALMASLGLRANKLTNTWVPFVAGSIARLNAGGRIAFVLPAELLQVTYAAQLRRFLANHFERIHIFACNRLVFQRAEQEIVLLLADGYSPEPSSECLIELVAAGGVEDLLASQPNHKAVSEYSTLDHSTEKWLKYFLSPREIDLMRAMKKHSGVTELWEHAEIDVGVVTGRNEFFVVTKNQIEEFDLGQYATPLVARSSHLRGAMIGPPEWKSLAQDGHGVHLLLLGAKDKPLLNAGAKRYIRSGEDRGFHTGYKCSVRRPWYLVPSIWSPDCFFFRQIYDFPRAVLNRAGAISTDTVHRMRCRRSPALVVRNLYTHLTAASAEIEGRSYGGGVLELEPNEAECLLMPKTLRKGLPLIEIDRLVRAGRLDEALAENDRLILGEIGITTSECAELKSIWRRMCDRRRSRKR